MVFDIIWSDSAARQLRRLDRTVARRVFAKVGDLRENPFPHVRRLVNSPYYRLRVGDYRVIMDIEQDVLRILDLKVGHRDSIYKR
ncbi:MAG: type II toxin-antitoxin system RelE/ParE family toxin [Thermoplasmata archaeon]